MVWDTGPGQAAGGAPMVTATAQEEWRSSSVGMGVVENTAVRENFGEKRWRVAARRVELCSFGKYFGEKNPCVTSSKVHVSCLVEWE